MSGMREGIIERTYSKEIKPGFTLHSITLVGDKTFYGTQTKQVTRPDGSALQPGDKCRFKCEENKYGMQVLHETFQAKPGTGAPPQTSNNRGGGSKEDFGARAKYWEDKERYDKEVTSAMINYRSSQMQAASLITSALDKDILPLAGSSKKDKFASLVNLVDELTKDTYRKLMAHHKELEDGKDSLLEDVSSDADLTTAKELAEMAQSEAEVPKEPSDDWDDDITF